MQEPPFRDSFRGVRTTKPGSSLKMTDIVLSSSKSASSLSSTLSCHRLWTKRSFGMSYLFVEFGVVLLEVSNGCIVKSPVAVLACRGRVFVLSGEVRTSWCCQLLATKNTNSLLSDTPVLHLSVRPFPGCQWSIGKVWAPQAMSLSGVLTTIFWPVIDYK